MRCNNNLNCLEKLKRKEMKEIKRELCNMNMKRIFMKKKKESFKKERLNPHKIIYNKSNKKGKKMKNKGKNLKKNI